MKKITIIGIIILFCAGINNSYAQRAMIKNESRFVYMTSVGILSGVGNLEFGGRNLPNNKNYIIDLHQLIAYQFNPYVTTGIGAGIDVWKRTAFIPIYAHVDVDFTDKPVSPHFFANIGYAFKWYVSSQPEKVTKVIHGGVTGIQAESGIGVKIKMKERLEFLLMAHYKLQQSDIKYSVVDPDGINYSSITTNRAQKMFYHFVGIKVGVLYW